MINILMMVCAMQTPGHCKNVALSFSDPGLTAYACVARGDNEVAKWAGENPDWRVAGYVCRKAGAYAKVVRTFQRGSGFVRAESYAYAISQVPSRGAR